MSSTKVYEIVTEKVLEALKTGTTPWRKPWKGGTMRPCNISGRPYSGGNFFLLSMFNYATPVFLTYKQILAAGGKIKEGENKKHFPIFFWSFVEKKDDNGKLTKIPFLRFFLVWNIEQTEGVELPKKFEVTKADHDPIEAAEAVIKGYPNAPKMVNNCGDRACYYPAKDEMCVPEIGLFTNPEEYYSTMFHEMGHSTGHTSRLNRKEVNDPITFGSHDYSLEELVAELTAAFLCAETGISNEVTEANTAAYIASWYKKLQDDPKMFWTAAGRAQKAADYILNRQAKEVSEEG